MKNANLKIALDNRKNILTLSNSNKVIFLEPVPPKNAGGNIEHYYHFIFNLILPLSYILEEIPQGVIFSLHEFGVFSKRLELIFPGRFKIEPRNYNPKDIKTIQLIGMNPRFVHLSTNVLEKFKTNIFRSLSINQYQQPNKILLIERLPPEDYYLEKATIKGGGTLRRSIKNHEDLTIAISAMVKAPFEFHNLQLEKISFKEQVQLFDQAIVVVAQHGAGLSNCVWMKQSSFVIELFDPTSSPAFKVINKIKKNNHYIYNISEPHVSIDIDDFSNWVFGIGKLKNFFS